MIIIHEGFFVFLGCRPFTITAITVTFTSCERDDTRFLSFRFKIVAR